MGHLYIPRRKNRFVFYLSVLFLFTFFVLVTHSKTNLCFAREYTGLPLVEFDTSKFSGSGNCSICHDLLYDKNGNSLSIEDHWRSTIMANASKDPFWQAKVSSEAKRNPSIKTIIEQKCVTCHMPMAWIESSNTGTFSPGFNDEDNSLHSIAMDGVSCSLCHQIAGDNLGTPESFSGNYVIDRETQKPYRTIYGPNTDPEQQTMATSVGYIPIHSPHIQQSKLCATCHTLYTPYVDSAGNVAGEFPEQTAYLEWQQSTFGDGDADDRTCQDCHLPEAPGKVRTARYAPSGTPKRAGFSQHHFVGSNVQMLKLLKANIDQLKITASSKELDATIKRTKNQLQNQTATISILNAEIYGKTLKAVVEVQSQVGHKFPTGIPCRRAWINFRILDNTGTIIFESGKPYQDGSIAGNINDSDINRFHPHYETITSPDQVQIYETIMADSDGEVTYTLLRAGSYLKDNRILPPGFDKSMVTKDIAVYGQAANDINFIGGSDRVTYEISGINVDGPLTIQADLLFTALSFSFLEDLRKDDIPLVNDFFKYWQKTDKSPTLIHSAAHTVP